MMQLQSCGHISKEQLVQQKPHWETKNQVQQKKHTTLIKFNHALTCKLNSQK